MDESGDGHDLSAAFAQVAKALRRSDPEQHDTLPHLRLRPMARAVQALVDPERDLQELYDPDSVTRQFDRPAPEIMQYAMARARTDEDDPPCPHRLQIVAGFRKGEPVLREQHVTTAKQLHDLTETAEYRRSRFYETTGMWLADVQGPDYERHVLRPLREAAVIGAELSRARAEAQCITDPRQRRMREQAIGNFDFGGEPGDSPLGITNQAMSAIDTEFVPLLGGPYFCLAGDTKIALLDGTERTIANLARHYADRSFWVYSINADGELVPGLAHTPHCSAIDVDLVEVELDNGERIRCTPNHQWMRVDGEYQQARDLVPGSALMPLSSRELRRQQAVHMHRPLAANPTVVAVRSAGRGDVYDFTVDEHHNFALSAGVFVHNSQLYLYAHWEQTAKAFEAKNHSELCRTAIQIMSDFALGRSLSWKIENDRVREVWDEFWTRNKMDTRMTTLCQDLCVVGETRIACVDGTNPAIAELADRNISGRNPLWVYSYESQTGRIVAGKATRCWRQPRKKRCVSVLLDNGEHIVASFDHPFLLRSGQYAAAESLQPGDSLMPLYRTIKNGRYEKLWHPEFRGGRWQVTHHALLGLDIDELVGAGISVHHRNGNKRDNRPDNLELLSTSKHLGAHCRERWAHATWRESIQETFRRTRSTRAGRARQRRNALQLWNDPERKARVIATIRATYRQPIVQQRHSEAVAKSWTNPDVRQRRVAGIKAAITLDERARRSERMRRLRAEQRAVPNHTVVRVEPAGDQWVYDLSVQTHHNFAVAAGVFTHNSWQGELLVRKNEVLPGFLRIRSIHPSTVYEIVTALPDIEDVLFYHLSWPSPYQLPYFAFRGQNLSIPTMRYVIEQLPPNEVHHIKQNVSSSEKWGRSDFFASLGTIKRHRDWTNAVTFSAMLQANMVWKIKLEAGDQGDVDSFIADTRNTTLPPAGSVWVENQYSTLMPMHTDVQSAQGLGQGSVGEFLEALFATGQQMPLAYFNVQTRGGARSVALVQSEPWVKRVASRQQVLRGLLDHLFEESMKCAIKGGRLDPGAVRGEDAEPEWIFPGAYEEDRGAKFRDLDSSYATRSISHYTLSTQKAQELGLADYDYDREMDDVGDDLENATLSGLPPLPGKPSGTAQSDNEFVGQHENIAGADAKADLRRQQQNRSTGAQTPRVQLARRLKRQQRTKVRERHLPSSMSKNE